jgi:DNA-binding transcriptional LysR family regulator
VPELRHLRYFVAVAEELNFSRAAKRLQMAQPPLSVAIRKLEQEIGTSLFIRNSREVKLTEAGRALLPGARSTLAEADAALTAARRAGAGELGSLRIGYNWSARFDTLPRLGRAFQQHRPDVELLTEEMRPNRMSVALRSGAIDVALALFPEISGELSYRRIRRERVVAVLSSSHPLAREEESASTRSRRSFCSSRVTLPRASTTSTSTSAAAPASSRNGATSRRVPA